MRRFGPMVLAIVVLALATTAAEAKRGRGWAVPIVVPGLSSSEVMVKVRDLPDGAPFVDKEGRQVHLGYLWPRSGEPRWVFRVSDRMYYEITPPALEAVKTAIGELPPVPERPGRAKPASSKPDALGADEELEARMRGEAPSTSSGRWSGNVMLFLLIGLGAMIAVWKFLRRPSTSDIQMAAQSSGGGRWVERAESRITPAAASTGRVTRPAVNRGSGSAGTVSISGLPPGRVGFGRRP